MRYLSLFSGVEAASLAWKPLGWEAAAFAEVDKFASAVLAHRLPETPNLGDVSKIDERQLEKLGKIDVVVFGSPCQDMSTSGKRQGLEHEGERTRSGLFYEAIRIVRLAQRVNGCGWFVMENVPGMLSCGGGRDFAEIVREISGCTFPVPRDGFRNAGIVKGIDGGWSAAWRTLDARFFGVPQRRRRVFIVGSLGPWTDPAEVLFVGESVRTHRSKSREAGKNYAHRPKGGNRGHGSRTFAVIPINMRLTARGDKMTNNRQEGSSGGAPGTGVGKEGDPSPSLGLSHVPAIAYGISSDATDRSGDRKGSAVGRSAGLGIIENASPTIRSRANNSVAYGVVRHFLPVETERLQGMPDDWTRVPYGNKPAELCPDGPRYKAIGNSFAVPVVRWLGERLQKMARI